MPAVFMGAEGRYEDWILLNMLQREWSRPVAPNETDMLEVNGRKPSPRAAIVLLFWTYFETKIERLLRDGMRDLPTRHVDDSLRRYASIGARMERLYSVVFDSTYKKDLNAIRKGDVWNMVAMIQASRNAFIHGDPSAIDDRLVEYVVDNLHEEHLAWISVYNLRAARSIEPR